MSRGLGWVQTACLEHIQKYEEDDEWPTTYDIAACVYRVKPDEDGLCYVTDAQHVAVKRALEGLQRKGRMIGLARRYCDGPFTVSDRRSNYSYYWMSERRAQQWVRKQGRQLHDALFERIKTKMRAIGMKVDESEPNHKASNPRQHADSASQGDQVN